MNGSDWLRLTLPVAFIAAFAELGYAVINNSVFSLFLTHGLGLDTALMTPVMVPFFVSEILFKGPLGVVADHWGRKPLMILGPAVSIFTPIVTILVPYKPHTVNVPYLCVYGFMRLLDGLGAAALWPATFAYIGDVVHESKRGRAMGLLNVTYILGLAFGFLAGGWVDDTFGPILSGKAGFEAQMIAVGRLVQQRMANMRARHLAHRVHRWTSGIGNHAPAAHPHGLHVAKAMRDLHSHFAASLPTNAAGEGVGHRFSFHPGPLDTAIFHQAHYYPSFYLACILFALATIVSVIAIRGQRPAGANELVAGDDVHSGSISWQGFADAVKQIPDMLWLTLTAFFGIGCIAQLVKLFAVDEFGLSEKEFGLLILWPAVIIGILAVPIGWMTDKWGKARSVRLGFIMCSLSMWSLIVLSSRPSIRDSALIIAGSLLGLGFVVAFPAWMALLTTISKEKSGTIIGAVSTAQGIGVGCGIVVGNWLYSHASRNIHTAHLAPFVVSAIFLSLATVLSFIIMRRGSSSVEPSPV